MLAAFGLFGVFLTVDLYRLVVVGPTSFGGPPVVETLVYLPLLVGRAVPAVATFPAVYYALLVGLTNSVEDLRETNHARVGRVTAALWFLSFGTGVEMYVCCICSGSGGSQPTLFGTAKRPPWSTYASRSPR